MAEVLMPRLSDSMEEGTIVRWLVEPGAKVRRGDELAEIETDKATMTYEADADGTLHIVATAGDTLPVGAPIAHLLADGETAADVPVPVAAASANRGQTPAPVAMPVTAASANGGARGKASPVARRLAAALGVELAGLLGSGPGGRIVKRDVEGAARATAVATAPAPPAPPPPNPVPAAPAPAPAAREEVAGGAKGAVTTEPLSRVQSTIARRMAEAKATMPEFTLTVVVDMDAAVELRARFKELGADVTPSVNDLVVKACALALRRHPRANGAYRDSAFELYERINVGVAVAAADALVVPVVHDADVKGLGQIARDTRRLAERARAGTLTPPELAGGTFSVSNLGMFGISQFTAVLNPPQAAILAVGALERRVVVAPERSVPSVADEKKGSDPSFSFAVGWRMTMTLTCDHRILYGADAAAFLADIRAELEQPLRLAL